MVPICNIGGERRLSQQKLEGEYNWSCLGLDWLHENTWTMCVRHNMPVEKKNIRADIHEHTCINTHTNQLMGGELTLQQTSEHVLLCMRDSY